MPIYEYRCEDCGKTVEAIGRVADPALTRCGEHCVGGQRVGGSGRGRLSRLVSAHNVGGSSVSGASGDPARCGACGSVPGSCAEN